MDKMQMMKLGAMEFIPRLNQTQYQTTTVVVVGCGGTGGRIIPIIAQHIANHNQEIATNVNSREYLKHQMRLILIDMDTVEAKNLKRQNFYQFDVGKGKAECLAERYSALYGLDIEYFDKPFDKCDLRATRNDHGRTDANMIIFDCTDNLNARKSIEALKRDAIIISCGNEDQFGQVVVSTINSSGSQRGGDLGANVTAVRNIDQWIREDLAKEEVNMKRKPRRMENLPTLLQVFKNFKDTEKPSCTEMEIQNEQSMPINMLVAQLAYNAFYDIVSGKGINYWMVRCNINNTFATEYVTNPLAMKNLFVKSIFGVNDDESLRLCGNIFGNYNQFTSRDAENVLTYAKDSGVYGYGILKIWEAHYQSYYQPNGMDKVRTAISEKHKELVEYLDGGS